MANNKSYVKLGVFVVIGLLLLVTGILLVGKKRFIFKESFEVEALFNNVSGLRKGAPVRVAGIEKGVVDNLIVPTEPNGPVRVIMKMDNATRNLIGPDAVADIKSQGFFGEKYIEIDIKNQTIPPVQGNEQGKADKRLVIKGEDADGYEKMVSKAAEAADSLQKAAQQFNEIGRKINEGEGSIGQLINDKELYKDVQTTVRTVQSSSKKLDQIVTHVRSGQGNLGELVYGRELITQVTATLTEANESAQKLSDILSDVKGGKGTVGKLLQDEQMAEDLQATLKSGRAAAENLNKLLAGIEKGEGPLGTLLGTGDGKNNMGNIIKEAQKAVGQMNEVLAAAKTNFLLSGYFLDRGYWSDADIVANQLTEPVNGRVLREYTFSTEDLFGKNSYTAKLKNKDSLYPIGVYLMAQKYSLAAIRVYLSDVGKTEDNMQLSQARAFVIREYLAKNFPLDEKSLRIKGYGEENAISFPKVRGAGLIRISVYQENNVEPATK